MDVGPDASRASDKQAKPIKEPAGKKSVLVHCMCVIFIELHIHIHKHISAFFLFLVDTDTCTIAHLEKDRRQLQLILAYSNMHMDNVLGCIGKRMENEQGYVRC